MKNFGRPVRLLIAGAVLGVGVAGGALVAVAADSNGDPAPEPNTTLEVIVSEPATSSSTTVAPLEETAPAPAPTEVTLARGFENYKPGDDLPTPPPAPTGDEPVQTVPGPYGPIYPDGYVAPEFRDLPEPPPPPPVETRPGGI